MNTQTLRSLNDCVLDGAKFFLLREWIVLPRTVLIIALQRVAQVIPGGIIRSNLRQLFEFIHDGIYHILERLFEISVLLFAADRVQRQRKLQQLLLDGGRRFGDGFHAVNQLMHDRPRRFGHFFVRHVLLDINFFQLVRVDRIGQDRLHMQQFVFPQKPIPRIVRPEHHVDMRMLALVVKRCIPVKMFRRDLHGLGKVILMCQQRQTPAFRIVIAKPRGILAAQRVNDRSDVALMRFQFLYCFFQIDVRFCAEESVPLMLFRAWAGGNIAHINALRVLV